MSFINALRKVEPHIVFTHYTDYYGYDHSTVSRIVNETSGMLSIKNIETENRPTKNNPYLYFMDTIFCKGFEPEEFVDISDVMEQKEEALLSHQSQYTWLKEHTNIDYLDMMITQAKIRGYQCGVEYAEAFIGVKTYPRVTCRSLLPQYL